MSPRTEEHRRWHGLGSDEPTRFDGLTFRDFRHTWASFMIAAANQAAAGQAVTVKSNADCLGSWARRHRFAWRQTSEGDVK